MSFMEIEMTDLLSPSFQLAAVKKSNEERVGIIRNSKVYSGMSAYKGSLQRCFELH